MRIAGLQMDIAWEDPQKNLAAARRLATSAKDAGARLIVLPEMFATGFSMDAEKTAASAEMIREGVAAIARDLRAWMIAGYAETVGTAFRNAAGVFDPDGKTAAVYHKIHPFSLAREHEHYEGGQSLATIDIDGVRTTPIVCYDLRFPEPFRIAASDTDLFCVIANWPDVRRFAWRSLLTARAIENQCYLLGINRVGTGDGMVYSGDSVIHDPFGESLASAAKVESIVMADIDPGVVTDVRRKLTFLADRRALVYQKIARDRAERSR